MARMLIDAAGRNCGGKIVFAHEVRITQHISSG
jgi:hypothetical protein